MVLLHAFPFDRRFWDDNVSALAQKFRVVRMELSGNRSIAEWSDDVAETLDALGIAMAALVGVSMGGYVALAFAKRHPARLSALVLADTRAGADVASGKKTRDEQIAKIRDGGLKAILDGMPKKLLEPSASEELQQRVRAIEVEREETVIAALTALRDRPDRTAELDEIRVPTLALVGEHDAITSTREAELMATLIPGAELCVIPNAGHLSNFDQPRAFEAEVLRFLDDAL